MKISPLRNIVHLRIDKPNVGVLNTSSKDSAIEAAEVLAVGKGVEGLEKGDKVFVKSWGIDIVSHEDEKYYFCNVESNAILAVIK